MSEQPVRICLLGRVDDVSAPLTRTLTDHGLEVVADTTGAQRRRRCDVVILVGDGQDGGRDLVESTLARCGGSPLMFLDTAAAGLPPMEAHLPVVETLRAGADSYVAWPIESQELLLRLHALARRNRLPLPEQSR